MKVGDIVKLNEQGKAWYPNDFNWPHNCTGVVNAVGIDWVSITWENAYNNIYVKKSYVEISDKIVGNPFKVGDLVCYKSGNYLKIHKVEGIHDKAYLSLSGEYFPTNYYNLEKFEGISYEGWETKEVIKIRNKDSKLLDFLFYNGHKLDRIRATLFQPFISNKFPGNISLYPDQKSYEREREVSMKPGRAFRKIFPEISDKEVETLVDEFNKMFGKRQFKLRVGTKPEDFKKAYAHTQSSRQNPETTEDRKSLANSCMRGSFDHLPHHPAEAYASGDFSIVYLEDVNGHIGGRCVVYTGLGVWHAGPIYGVCETSLDMIEDYLKENNAKTFCYGSDWYGAKLNRIPFENGFIAPYIDGYEELSDDGEYLVIDGGGEIDCTNYSGVLAAYNLQTCECCGERFEEDYMTYVDGRGNYCECCRDDELSYCSIYERYVLPEDVITYYSSEVYGNYYVNSCHTDHVGDTVFMCTISDEYYHVVYITFDTYNGDPVAEHLAKDQWLWDNNEGFYFPPETANTIITKDGEELLVYKVPSDFVEGEDGKFYEHKEAA